MRSTHPFEEEELMAYLDGEMPADRAAEIALHMRQCNDCQSLAAGLRNVSQQLAAWQIEASPARLTEEVASQLAAAGPLQPPAKLSSVDATPLRRALDLFVSRKTRPWAWVGAGALAMFALMVLSVPHLYRSAPHKGMAASHHSSVDGIGATDKSAAKYRQEASNLQALARKAEAQQQSSFPAHSATTAGIPPVSSDTSSAGSSPTSVPPSAPMIARTATLAIIAKDFGSVEAAVKGVTNRHSGYIGELNTASPTDAAKTLSATLRVPSAQLEAALAELKQLGSVDHETQGGEEVTKQYTDLVARLKNSRATEQRLLDVLRNNTGKVKDVLEVENEIARVRGEIEEMEADQRGLQARVDFATITLSVTEEYKASLQSAPPSIGTRLNNSFVEGYHGMVENIVALIAWLLEAGPTLLLWAAIFFFPVRWGWRRLRRTLRATAKLSAA